MSVHSSSSRGSSYGSRRGNRTRSRSSRSSCSASSAASSGSSASSSSDALDDVELGTALQLRRRSSSSRVTPAFDSVAALHLAASRSSRSHTARSTIYAVVDEVASAPHTASSQQEGSAPDNTCTDVRGGGNRTPLPVLRGLGMLSRSPDPPPRAHARTSSHPHRRCTSRIEVRTPFISVEGIHPQQRGPDVAHAVLSSSAAAASGVTWVSALSRRITQELLGLTPPSWVPSTSSPSAFAASQTVASTEVVERSKPRTRPEPYHEVLTIGVGAAGAGKTSLLLGRVRESRHNCPHPSGGGCLLEAVVEHLFASAGQASRSGVCEVAVSLLEVRDAAPLSALSAQERVSEAVDLLSGNGRTDAFVPPPSRRLRRSERNRASATGCFMRKPCDLPAARYVFCASPSEVYAVVCEGLSHASTAWQPLHRRSTRPSHDDDESSDDLINEAAGSEDADPGGGYVELDGQAVVRGRGQKSHRRTSQRPQQPLHQRGMGSKAGHVLLTLVVCASPTHGSVGVWKLWDLAGPCMTRTASNEDSGWRTPKQQRSRERDDGGSNSKLDSSIADRTEDAPQQRDMTEFAARTHAGLVAVLGTGICREGSHEAGASPSGAMAARCDPVCRLVHSSLAYTTSLLTLVGVARQDVAAEGINEDVLRCAAAAIAASDAPVAAVSVLGDGDGNLVRRQRRQYRRRQANRVAALRVLERFAVDAEDFLGFNVRASGSATGAACETSSGPRCATQPLAAAADFDDDGSRQDDDGGDPLSINVTSIVPDKGSEHEVSGLSELKLGTEPITPAPPRQGDKWHTEVVTAASVGHGHTPSTPPSIPGTQRPSLAEKKQSIQRLRGDLGASGEDHGKVVAAAAAAEGVVGVQLFPSVAREGEDSAVVHDGDGATLSRNPKAAETSGSPSTTTTTTTTVMMDLQERFRVRVRQALRAHPLEKASRDEEALLARLAAVVRSNADELSALTLQPPGGCGDDDGMDGPNDVSADTVGHNLATAAPNKGHEWAQQHALLTEQLTRSTKKILWLEERLLEAKRKSRASSGAASQSAHVATFAADLEDPILQAFTETVQGVVTDLELMDEERTRLRREVAMLQAQRGNTAGCDEAAKPRTGPMRWLRRDQSHEDGSVEGSRQQQPSSSKGEVTQSRTAAAAAAAAPISALSEDRVEERLSALLSRAFRTAPAVGAHTPNARKTSEKSDAVTESVAPAVVMRRATATLADATMPRRAASHEQPTARRHNAETEGAEDTDAVAAASKQRVLVLRNREGRHPRAPWRGRQSPPHARGGGGEDIPLEVTAVSALSSPTSPLLRTPDSSRSLRLSLSRSPPHRSGNSSNQVAVVVVRGRSSEREDCTPRPVSVAVGAAAAPPLSPAQCALREAALRVQNNALLARQQQPGPQERRPSSKNNDADDELYDALRELHQANLAMDAEVRAAAVRECEYLNQIL